MKVKVKFWRALSMEEREAILRCLHRAQEQKRKALSMALEKAV